MLSMFNPIVDKLILSPARMVEIDLSVINYVGFDYSFARVIPDGMFTAEEIEVLRQEHKKRWEIGYGAFVANFLPDNLRPKDVPKDPIPLVKRED